MLALGAFLPARPADARARRAPPPQLFCGNLPFSVDSAQLTNLFAEYGCSDAKVVYDQQSGRSKGIAFLTFASEAQAMKAQEAMNGTVRARRAAARRLTFAHPGG